MDKILETVKILDFLPAGKNNLNNVEFYKTRFYTKDHSQGGCEEFCISRYIFSCGLFFDITSHKNHNDYTYSDFTKIIINNKFNKGKFEHEL
jgi:hypothetical protein